MPALSMVPFFKLQSRGIVLILAAGWILLMALFFSVLLWATLSWSIFKVWAGHWVTQNQKSLSNEISRAANCHLWCSYKCLSKHFHILHFLISSEGLKEISFTENTFFFSLSFLERQARLLPSSPCFSIFLCSAVWCNQLLWGNVFHCLQPQTHQGLSKPSWGQGAVEWQTCVSKPNN